MKFNKDACRRLKYIKLQFLNLFMIEEINNFLISINFVFKNVTTKKCT